VPELTLIEEAPCGLLAESRGGTITLCNPAFLAWVGRPAAEVVGLRAFRDFLISPSRVLYDMHAVPKLLLGGGVEEMALDLQNVDGLSVPVLVNAKVNHDRSLVTYAVFGADRRRRYEQELRQAHEAAEHAAAEARRLNDEISHQAMHDPLTGLANRRQFERRLQAALDLRESRPSVLCFIDLDQFKVVNDSLGHHAGDELLRQLSARLLACIRQSDTLARLGGDEFGVLLDGCDAVAAMRVAEKMRAMVSSHSFQWHGKALRVGTSIGMVELGSEATDVTTAMRDADVACYAAKESGRNRIQLFRPSDAALRQRRGEMAWVGELQRAIAADRLELHVQPIVPLSGPALRRRGEVLVRLRDEEGTLHLPGAFLPAAERYGQMAALDAWVFRRSLDAMQRIEDLDLSINVSGSSLSEGDFHHALLEALHTSGVSPSRITLEITETAAISNLPRATEFMQTLRARGCRFALDDFGSGLSSFTYLKQLGVDCLKIDGSFVKNLDTSDTDRIIVKAVVDIARGMGIRSVAEWIGTAEVLRCVRELGVDDGQGFAIGMPEPL
jgi:Amt family ammonium transporter